MDFTYLIFPSFQKFIAVKRKKDKKQNGEQRNSTKKKKNKKTKNEYNGYLLNVETRKTNYRVILLMVNG